MRDIGKFILEGRFFVLRTLSLIAHYRRGGEWGTDEGGRWEAGGGLNPPLGLFGLAMNPRSSSYGAEHA